MAACFPLSGPGRVRQTAAANKRGSSCAAGDTKVVSRLFHGAEQTASLLDRRFVRNAARHPFRTCVIDSTAPVPVYNYGRVLAGAILFSRRLRPMLGQEGMVGIWLPPGVGGVFANLAIAFLGKAAVNLNYTSSPDSIQSAIRQCNIRHVLTSRRFTSRLPLPPLPTPSTGGMGGTPALNLCFWKTLASRFPNGNDWRLISPS